MRKYSYIILGIIGLSLASVMVVDFENNETEQPTTIEVRVSDGICQPMPDCLNGRVESKPLDEYFKLINEENNQTEVSG